jgi:uncharacterized membrane protein YgcG
MARLKRTSAVVDTASKRLSGLKGIGEPNLGPTLTVTMYEAKIDAVVALLNAYNQKIAELDQMQNDLQAAEAELNDLNRRFLSAGEAQFGPDSNEYEMLGGTRKSERKKPTKKGSGGSGGTSGGGSGGTSGGGSGGTSGSSS